MQKFSFQGLQWICTVGKCIPQLHAFWYCYCASCRLGFFFVLSFPQWIDSISFCFFLGIQSFCKDLLEVADILEKATESVPKEEIKDENPHLKSLYEGLVMTEVQIQKVFKKHGLLRLDPVGAKFDPYEHEALFHAPMEGKEPGTIALVSKIGYKLHGRTLRPALVGVVKDA